MKKEKCPICGSKIDKVLLTIKTPDRFESFVGIKTAGYKRKWVECSNCGLAVNIRGYENSKLKELETAYYEVDFKNSSIEDKYEKVMGLPPEKSDNAQRVQRIHAFVADWFSKFGLNKGAKLKVLDVGAGTGVFMSRFLDDEGHDGFLWQGTAVESDPLACKHLGSLGKFELKKGIFPGKFNLKNFDLCTLNKIVEHIENPISFLQQIKKALNPDRGILYMEVPDKLTINERPSGDNILGALHYHLYDPKSLVCLLEKADFMPIQVVRFIEPSGKISIACFATLRSAIHHVVAK